MEVRDMKNNRYIHVGDVNTSHKASSKRTVKYPYAPFREMHVHDVQTEVADLREICQEHFSLNDDARRIKICEKDGDISFVIAKTSMPLQSVEPGMNDNASGAK